MQDNQRGPTPAALPHGLDVVGLVITFTNLLGGKVSLFEATHVYERVADVVDFLSGAGDPAWPDPVRRTTEGDTARVLYALDASAPQDLIDRAKAAIAHGFDDMGVAVAFEDVGAEAVRAAGGALAVVTPEMLEAVAAWLPTNQPED